MQQFTRESIAKTDNADLDNDHSILITSVHPYDFRDLWKTETEGKKQTSQFKISTKYRNQKRFCECSQKPFMKLQGRVLITY